MFEVKQNRKLMSEFYERNVNKYNLYYNKLIYCISRNKVCRLHWRYITVETKRFSSPQSLIMFLDL